MAEHERRPCRALTLANGIGGFADDGRTYAIVLEGDQDTPPPWANVIANPRFGTIVSARAHRHDVVGEQPREPADAVCQRSGDRSDGGEAIYIRDDDTGRAWSPTPGPMARDARRAAAS